MALHLSTFSLKQSHVDHALECRLKTSIDKEESTRRARSASFASIYAAGGAGPSPSPTSGADDALDAFPISSAAAPVTMDSKILAHLIGTLNEVFPDYNFEKARSTDFERSDVASVVSKVNYFLTSIATREAAAPTLSGLLDEMFKASATAAKANASAGGGASGGGASGGGAVSTEITHGKRRRRLNSGASEDPLQSGEPSLNASQQAVQRFRDRLSELSSLSLLSILWIAVDIAIGTGITESAVGSGVEVYTYKSDLEALSAGAIWSFNFIFVNPKLNRVLFFAASARLGPPVSPVALAAVVQKRARHEGRRASGIVGVADSDDGRSSPRDSDNGRNILVDDAADDEGSEDGDDDEDDDDGEGGASSDSNDKQRRVRHRSQRHEKDALDVPFLVSPRK